MMSERFSAEFFSVSLRSSSLFNLFDYLRCMYTNSIVQCLVLLVIHCFQRNLLKNKILFSYFDFVHDCCTAKNQFKISTIEPKKQKCFKLYMNSLSDKGLARKVVGKGSMLFWDSQMGVSRYFGPQIRKGSHRHIPACIVII